MEQKTLALVLDFKIFKENDKIIDLYTKKRGRICARLVGGRKITSKLSPQLNPLTFSLVRIVEKNEIRIADALEVDNLSKIRQSIVLFGQALKLIEVLKEMIMPEQPDLDLWFFLRRSLTSGKISYFKLLSILGYSPQNSNCLICHQKKTDFFWVQRQAFICQKCLKGLKGNQNRLILKVNYEN